jgi:hypothetical protein
MPQYHNLRFKCKTYRINTTKHASLLFSWDDKGSTPGHNLQKPNTKNGYVYCNVDNGGVKTNQNRIVRAEFMLQKINVKMLINIMTLKNDFEFSIFLIYYRIVIH